MEDSISIIHLCFRSFRQYQMTKIDKVVVVITHDEDGKQLTQRAPIQAGEKKSRKINTIQKWKVATKILVAHKDIRSLKPKGQHEYKEKKMKNKERNIIIKHKMQL